jgi:hypothetical protein
MSPLVVASESVVRHPSTLIDFPDRTTHLTNKKQGKDEKQILISLRALDSVRLTLNISWLLLTLVVFLRISQLVSVKYEVQNFKGP